jgi:dUTPase
MLHLLQGNQDFLLEQLNNIKTSLQDTKTTLAQFMNQSAPASMVPSSNSQSLSSDLSYTMDQPDAQSKHHSISSNNRPGYAEHTSLADKKLFVNKFTYDPNDRVGASRWYKDVQSLLSASAYYNAMLDENGNINLSLGDTIENHNLYNILYRCIDEKFQKVAHSSQWQLGTDILSFVHNTFSDNSTFLDDARDAHTSLSQLRWNASKETLMDFAATVSDLYAKLKSTDYERIITPIELRRLWIMALPLPIFTTIRGKITTNDQLPSHWLHATTISSLIEATRKEIASQKAHTTLANMLKKGTQQEKTPPPAKSDSDTTPKPPPAKASGDPHRHPIQKDFKSQFDTMRAIDNDVFQGLAIEEIHNKYKLPQDENTCVLCRFKSNNKRFHHTKDCQEIKHTFEKYDSVNNTNSNVTVYLISNQCSKLITSKTLKPSQLCHDTGAPLHLFNNKTFFSNITYFPPTNQPSVALGDEKKLLPITAYGIADFIAQHHRIRIKAYLVPGLGTNLYSPTQHIKYNNCSYTLSHNTMRAQFPNFKITLQANQNITCNIIPSSTTNQPIAFDETQATLCTTSQLDIKLLRLHPQASLPFRATSGSVGYDLTSYNTITIEPHNTTKIPLGFALDIPSAFRCQVASRSSLAAKGIIVVGGVIDNDYRGDVTVILSNLTNQPITLPAYSKIAQLLFIPSALPEIRETSEPLSHTDRSSNGFGSTNTPVIPCRRINRPVISLPPIVEVLDETDHDTASSLSPSSCATATPKTTQKHDSSTANIQHTPTVHVNNPPSRLRQTTLDAFLQLHRTTPAAQPSLHPQDRVNSSTPALVSMTSELFQKCTGFRNIHKIMHLIKQHAAPTIDIQDLGRDPFLSRGEVATLLPKARRNTSPVPRPDVYGSIIHYDIGYGAGMAIGGYTHVLFLVDRATRKKFIYGLKSLHVSHITAAMSEFIKDLGCYPSKMLADRDFKIIGDQVKSLFRPHTFERGDDLNFTGTHVSGAPQGRQNQNGLSEGNWKYVCNMARNFLNENLLPRQFWFHALKYAVQVSNYLPVKLTNGQVSTPYELAHGTTPDYRKLIPLFAVGHTKVDTTTAQHNSKYESQTVPTILIGNDDQSDGCLFYNPSTKSIIASADYRLGPSRPSGPLFNLPHEDTSFGLTRYNPTQSTPAQVPAFSLGDEVFITSSPSDNNNDATIQHATILSVPLSDSLPYTIQLQNGQIREEYVSALSPHNPAATMQSSTSNPISWITHGSKVTIFLTNKMTSPKQGYLIQSNTNQWSFLPGRAHIRNNRNTPIPLPNFEQLAPSLVRQNIIAQHWLTNKSFLEKYNLTQAHTTLARRIVLTGSASPELLTNDNVEQQLTDNPANAIATIFKISATNLDSHHEPKLHEHYKLSPKDKQIWDESYREEYFGLHKDTQTWHYITEEEYQNMKHILGRPLPTMAISQQKSSAMRKATQFVLNTTSLFLVILIPTTGQNPTALHQYFPH